MIRVRRLTHEGLQEASVALARIRSAEVTGLPPGLLDDPATTELTGRTLQPAREGELLTRWHLALWLFRELSGGPEQSDRPDPAEWSWLALHLLDVVCPVGDGRRRVREDARYLMQADDYRKAHRHLVAGPYLLLEVHQEDPSAVRGLLATPPDAPGEVYEQLASRKYLVTSRAVVAVATMLYLDGSSGKLRRGAGGSGPGSPRRFSEVLQQFEVTYDLPAMSREALLGLLPREFSRFLSKQLGLRGTPI